MRTLLALLMICSPALAADPALVERDDGKYLLYPDRKELVKIECVIDQRTGDAPEPPTEPDEPEGELTPRAAQIAALTEGVGTREEAAALASVAQALADQGVSGKVAWDAAFRISLNRVSGSVSDQWSNWKASVDVFGDEYPVQFFADVASGVAHAADIELSQVKAAADGDAKADLELGKEPAIDIVAIIELIKFILQLLEDLGIFDSDEAALSYVAPPEMYWMSAS